MFALSSINLTAIKELKARLGYIFVLVRYYVSSVMAANIQGLYQIGFTHYFFGILGGKAGGPF